MDLNQISSHGGLAVACSQYTNYTQDVRNVIVQNSTHQESISGFKFVCKKLEGIELSPTASRAAQGYRLLYLRSEKLLAVVKMCGFEVRGSKYSGQ